jgi:protein-disulfide isomerase
MNRIARGGLALLMVVWGAWAQAPQTKAATPNRSAFDKATIEEYVRHLFVWGKNIKVEVMDARPSQELPGFYEIGVRASVGEASQTETFLVSKDGHKIMRAEVFDVNQNPFKANLDKLNTENAPSMGTPGAPVVIVVFTDFECPVCKQEAAVLRQNLLSAYPKEVRLYLKEFPLVQMHPWAKAAAIAGRCIYRQNPASFWGFQDWVYDRQADLTPENFKTNVLAFAKEKEKEIDTMQLTSCIDSRATESEVDRTLDEGHALRVTGTPTLFINGRRLEGPVPWPNLREIIDYEIEYQKTAKNAGEDCGCEVKVPSPVSTTSKGLGH